MIVINSFSSKYVFIVEGFSKTVTLMILLSDTPCRKYDYSYAWYYTQHIPSFSPHQFIFMSFLLTFTFTSSHLYSLSLYGLFLDEFCFVRQRYFSNFEWLVCLLLYWHAGVNMVIFLWIVNRKTLHIIFYISSEEKSEDKAISYEILMIDATHDCALLNK